MTEATPINSALPEADKLGHRTRYSDSSVYDEKCVLCGATDARGSDKLDKPCPKATSEATPINLGGANIGLRKWRAYRNIVEIEHTRDLHAGPGDQGCLQAAVNAYTSALAAAPTPPLGIEADELARLNELGQRVLRSQRSAPGYIGTADDACTFVTDVLAILSRLSRPIPAGGGAETDGGRLAGDLEPEKGCKRDLAIRRVADAKNRQQPDVPNGMALVSRHDLIELFHHWWWTKGVAFLFRDQKAALQSDLDAARERVRELEARPKVSRFSLECAIGEAWHRRGEESLDIAVDAVLDLLYPAALSNPVTKGEGND